MDGREEWSLFWNSKFLFLAPTFPLGVDELDFRGKSKKCFQRFSSPFKLWVCVFRSRSPFTPVKTLVVMRSQPRIGCSQDHFLRWHLVSGSEGRPLLSVVKWTLKRWSYVSFTPSPLSTVYLSPFPPLPVFDLGLSTPQYFYIVGSLHLCPQNS